MPKLDSLQNQFTNDLQVITVAFKDVDREKEEPKIRNSNIYKQITLPIGASNPDLLALFPFNVLGHHV